MSEFHVKVVEIGEVSKHPNADTLSITFIGGTGGYPVIGVVHPSDLAGLAQRRPGAAVRFVVVTRKR